MTALRRDRRSPYQKRGQTEVADGHVDAPRPAGRFRGYTLLTRYLRCGRAGWPISVPYPPSTARPPRSRRLR